MRRGITSELEFDKVLQLVAAQARTRLGRALVTTTRSLPRFEAAVDAARRTDAVERLLEDGGTMSFAGLDEAWRWLEPGAPAASEPRDLLTLLNLARRIAAVRKRLLAGPPDLEQVARTLPDTGELIRQVAPRLDRDGTIPDQASPELARLRRQSTRLRQQLLEQLDGLRRAHPGVATDAPPTLRRDRYCLPVRSGSRAELPGLLLDSSGSGATAFLEPFQIVELNNQLTEATAGEREEIRRIVAEIAAEFAREHDRLAAAVHTLAALEAVQARVLFGRHIEGRVVAPSDAGDLLLRDARHPLLDPRLHSLRVEIFGEDERRDPERQIVPLDFRLPAEVRVLVVSGPNAGGKTVVLKTLGLMVLMAYHGIPLPVGEGTVIPRFDHLWCHIGDEQDVAADLSSFSGAMAATVDLLEEAGSRSLVLYDELGAGTDPLEGAALGIALLEVLAARSSLTVATTHLAAIAMAAGESERLGNAAMGYDEVGERPTYRLAIGRPGRSRALEIAAATGIDRAILARARQLLGGQHLELHRWLERLERLEGALVEERQQLAAQGRELQRLQEETSAERARLIEELELVPVRLAEERDRLRRRAQLRLDEALARLDQAIAEGQELGRRQRQRLRDEALAIGAPSLPAEDATEILQLAPDTPVRLTSIGRSGVVEEVRGASARVRVDDKRLWVAVADLEPEGEVPTIRPTATVEVPSDDSTPGELVLLGLDSERARDELERFLDRALTSGRTTVRVVHGHGTGTLRRMVGEVCRSHPAVRSYRHPPQHLGGTGVTEVELVGGG